MLQKTHHHAVAVGAHNGPAVVPHGNVLLQMARMDADRIKILPGLYQPYRLQNRRVYAAKAIKRTVFSHQQTGLCFFHRDKIQFFVFQLMGKARLLPLGNKDETNLRRMVVHMSHNLLHRRLQKLILEIPILFLLTER